MKKLIASILCACTISTLLVGCGSTSDQADQAGDTTAETQTDAESEESTESTGDAGVCGKIRIVCQKGCDGAFPGV